jgi:hypothetical protein
MFPNSQDSSLTMTPAWTHQATLPAYLIVQIAFDMWACSPLLCQNLAPDLNGTEVVVQIRHASLFSSCFSEIKPGKTMASPGSSELARLKVYDRCRMRPPRLSSRTLFPKTSRAVRMSSLGLFRKLPTVTYMTPKPLWKLCMLLYLAFCSPEFKS